MGQNSSIEWTDHTFNPWWGCVKVSPGCTNCYAESLSHRWGHDVWGPAKTTPRRKMSRAYWQQSLRWDHDAAVAGVRKRVFCASMADVFEDHPQVEDWRNDLFELIEMTAHLDWLLLTKRPENMLTMPPIRWRYKWPDNVWAMTSVEDQQRADERIPYLLRVPARVRGLSCEPLLSEVWLRPEWLYDPCPDGCGCIWPDDADANECACWGLCCQAEWDDRPRKLHWVIAGGESGHGARPMQPDWARSLRDQCQAAGVSYFFKQWGEWLPFSHGGHGEPKHSYTDNRNGLGPSAASMHRVGKRTAGRLLDGREWNEFPEVPR
jgi:protein gp37